MNRDDVVIDGVRLEISSTNAIVISKDDVRLVLQPKERDAVVRQLVYWCAGIARTKRNLDKDNKPVGPA